VFSASEYLRGTGGLYSRFKKLCAKPEAQRFEGAGVALLYFAAALLRRCFTSPLLYLRA
jgi:hypothetical protein